MPFNINEIRANMPWGGARPTQFTVMVTNPVNPIADLKLPFQCRAASLPGSSLGVIQIPYFGRTIKVPGDREFQPWTTTVFNDEDFAIRDMLERWSNAINALERNVADLGSAPANYKSQAIVTQYGKGGDELRIYQFNGIWPSEISPIDLDWDARDQIETFQVVWQYDSFSVVGGNTGDGGGE
jgi:hypothetical protein